MEQHRQLAVIILNWKNASDTIECLDSVLKATKSISSFVFIVDNGSGDNSVEQIRSWLKQQEINFSHFKREGKGKENFHSGSDYSGGRVCLLENHENLGFAKGNNVAIKFTLHQFPVSFEKYLLLNNDTIVPPQGIDRLLKAAEIYPEFLVWTPVIVYADQKDKVWNAGGFLGQWGGRKYLAHKKPKSRLPSSGVRQITFITGCALLVDKSIWEKNIFFNEDFFFGEEDYFFSMQMKKLKIKMAVAFDAVIYHKISSSIQQVSPKSLLPLLFIHFLNRTVDMKKWMSPLFFRIWRPGFMLHAAFNSWWKHWYSFSTMWQFTRLLELHSRNKTKVTKEDFFGAGKLFESKAK
ncbi:MAG: glycosyl transferase family 2 [bacterium]|nr:MAG: glycosyl transferase family 2 [bacterium]